MKFSKSLVLAFLLLIAFSATGCAKSNTVAVFETNMGNFTIQLETEKAPITTKNFIDLVEKNYYSGVTFHRIIDGFMIQGGDPTGTGRGGPGYQIKDEFHPDLKHNSEGILSMANSGPDSGGSQFFITLAPTPHLYGRHAVFGKLIDGISVVRSIGKVATNPVDNKPLIPVVIKNIKIEKK